MRAVIIDDDPSMRENLNSLLSIYCVDITLVGEADGVKSGVDLIRTVNPDLVFMDIEMKDGTGFDVLSISGKPTFKLIFVTGHDQYAIKAFKFSAIDYILKPVDPDDLIRAVDKARRTSMAMNKLQIETLVTNRAVGKSKKMVLNDAQNTYLITIENIIRCESDVNYTRFFLSDHKSILVSKTLKSFDELLDEYGFFRCHQSHLINLNYFDRYEKTEGGMVHLKNGEVVPISVRKKEELMSKLSKL